MRCRLSVLALALLGGGAIWGADECGFGGYAMAATAVSATKIDLFYLAPEGSLPAGSVVYSLFRGTSPSSLVEIARTTSPFYEDVGGSPAVTYYYAVNAISGGSTISANDCVTTPALPNAPGNFAATVNSSTSITLSWTETVGAGTLAITGFDVYGGTSPSDLSKLATVKAVSYGYKASPGTTYYFTVSAVDTDGDQSGKSAVISVTTPE